MKLQLRGRVGRKDQQSYCFLLTSDNADPSKLEILAQSANGFEIAERDLEIRGPGTSYLCNTRFAVNFLSVCILEVAF